MENTRLAEKWMFLSGRLPTFLEMRDENPQPEVRTELYFALISDPQIQIPKLF